MALHKADMSSTSSTSSTSTFTFKRRLSHARAKRMGYDKIRQDKIKALDQHTKQNPVKKLWGWLFGKARHEKAPTRKPPVFEPPPSAQKEASRHDTPLPWGPPDEFVTPGDRKPTGAYDRRKRWAVYGMSDLENHARVLKKEPPGWTRPRADR